MLINVNQKSRMFNCLVAALAVASVSLSAHAAVPHTFTAGAAAVAAEVNENFSNLDNRVSALEGVSGSGPTIAVDCTANPTAFKDLTPVPNATYVLTGMCDGPIAFRVGLGTINVEGDANGIQDDGVSHPLGLSDGDTDFSAIWATNGVRLNLRNLVVSADNYISESDLYVSVVQASRGAHITLTDVSVTGGDTGVSAWNGYVSINAGVTVSGFRDSGMSAGVGGSIHVWEPSTVTGGSNLEGTTSSALVAYQNGVLEVRQGGTFTGGSGDGSVTPFYSEAASAVDNGSINVRNSGTSVLNGSVGSYRSSSLRVDAGTINGVIESGEQSMMRLSNVTQSGNIDAYRNGVLRIHDSNIAGGASDTIFVGGMSVMRMDDTEVGNASGTGSIGTYRYGSISLRGASNLNGRTIDCPDIQGINIRNTVTNVGAISCAPSP